MKRRTQALFTALFFIGCGNQQNQNSQADNNSNTAATCDFAGPKALCRSSVEGVRAHIEEFGPLQTDMDWVILDGFDPGEVEELSGITSVLELRLSGHESKDLAFLKGLDSANRIIIERNPRLETLRGLENLTRVGDSMRLDENVELKTLEGLENLTYLGDPNNGEGLTLIRNTKLESIEGLSALEESFAFIIQNNASLKNPGTLPNLKRTGGFVFLNNDALENTGVYPSLQEAKTLKFERNDIFPECEAEKFAEAIPNFEGDLILEDNKPNSRCEDIE